MRFDFIKRQYTDIRLGMVTFSPIIALSNFVIVAYSLTQLKDIISIEVFTVGFSIFAIILFVIIGKTFRKVQLKTDQALNYERNTELVKTQRLILELLHSLNKSNPDMKLNNDALKRIGELKKFENT